MLSGHCLQESYTFLALKRACVCGCVGTTAGYPSALPPFGPGGLWDQINSASLWARRPSQDLGRGAPLRQPPSLWLGGGRGPARPACPLFEPQPAGSSCVTQNSCLRDETLSERMAPSPPTLRPWNPCLLSQPRGLRRVGKCCSRFSPALHSRRVQLKCHPLG